MSKHSTPRPRTRLTLRPVTDLGVERHASWLELFFDLIFVLVVAQVAHELSGEMSIAGFIRFLFLFILPWWTWMGYTFYADRFEAEGDVVYRLMMLGGMLAVAALAVNIHGAFHGHAATFAATYVAARVVLILLYFRVWLRVHMARELSAAYLIGFSLGAAIWIASIFIPEPARYWLWGIGLAVELLTPLVSRRAVKRTPYDASHIPERFGLFTIIVLGEAVLGATTAMTVTDWNMVSASAAALSFAISAGLWWVYFEFSEACDAGLWRLAGLTYVYLHLPTVLGLTIVGVGLRNFVLEAPTGTLTTGTRWALAGGTALYLISLFATRLASKRRELMAARLAVAAAALVLATAGGGLPPLALEGILLGALIVQIVMESRHERRMMAEEGHAEPTPEARAAKINIPTRPCDHLGLVADVSPGSDGCEECLALGEDWVEARLCLICGHVGCCDTSKNRHAWKHFQETGHPLIETAEPGTKWRWCYIDETYLPAGSPR